eukprot:scaffold1581_cov342-Prasinococcus_capsulatus_cf.AAC.9
MQKRECCLRPSGQQAGEPERLARLGRGSRFFLRVPRHRARGRARAPARAVAHPIHAPPGAWSSRRGARCSKRSGLRQDARMRAPQRAARSCRRPEQGVSWRWHPAPRPRCPRARCCWHRAGEWETRGRPPAAGSASSGIRCGRRMARALCAAACRTRVLHPRTVAVPQRPGEGPSPVQDDAARACDAALASWAGPEPAAARV